MSNSIQTLEDGIELLIQSKLEKLYTAAPGEILKVNYDSYTVDCKITVPIKSSFTDILEESVVIRDVPIAFPSGKKFKISYPIDKGDQCLLLFSQSDLDIWKRSVVPLQKVGERRFHVADAIAIPSLYPPIQSKISNPLGFDNTNVYIEGNISVNGTICVGGAGQGSVALASEVENVFNQIKNIFLSMPPAIPQDGGATISTHLRTQFAQIATTRISSRNLKTT